MNSAADAKLIDIVPVANTLGEGALWDPVGSVLWWTDIQEKRLYRYTPQGKALKQYDLPERLGSFALVAGREGLVAAFASGFAFYHPDSGRLEWLQRPTHSADNMRFNDGRVDRVGRFWAGSMVEGKGEASAQLYCLKGGQIETHLSGIAIGNSLCFSPDGRYLYFADSPQRIIWRFDLDASTGLLTNRKVFVQTPEGSYPDGSNVDAEGHVWNAHWGGGRIVRYAPDGTISGSIALPVSQPTCVAFGGENLDILYITTAREHLGAQALAREPQAGHVFAYQLPIRGTVDARYQP